MPSLASLLMLALAALGSRSSDPAASDSETSALAASQREIVVVVERDCFYCLLFRRDLFPAYVASPRSREVPMRFVDVAELASSRLSLSRAVDVVPTVLVLSQGAEIGRIPGYASKEVFFNSINALLPLQ
jgi:thioredoxin-related protein